MGDAKPLRVGDILHGFLGGVFGRDHYDCSRVEAIGADWVVARTLAGKPVTATGRDVVKDVESARAESDVSHSYDCSERSDDDDW